MTVTLDFGDDHAGQAKPKKTKNTLTVQTGGSREEKKVEFDSSPLLEQVERVCSLFDIFCDAEDNYYVLTRGTGPYAPVITSEAALLCLPAGAHVSLRSGTELVQERLQALRTATKEKLALALRGFCGVFCGDAWVSEEVIECQGIGMLLDSTTSTSPDATEVAAAGLCELFQYPNAVTWLQQHQTRLNENLFGRLLNVLFPAPDESSTSDEDEGSALKGRAPRATLCMFIFLLYMFPDRVEAAHAAAQAEEGSAGPVYQRMVEAAEGTFGDEFQVAAAMGLFSAMGIASADKQSLAEKIQGEVVAASTDNAEGEELFAQCQRPEHFSERLLEMWMGSCSVMVLRHDSGGQVGNTTADGQELETRILRLQEVVEQMKSKLRLQHQTMCAMVPFMKIENSALVGESLDSIIRLGWESLHWKQGYSLLHCVAETSDDPQVVELVGLLATDSAIDARDDFGKRPIDYARPRQQKAPGVVKVIEKLRRDERRRTKYESASTKQAVSEHLSTKLEKLKDLTPPLQQAIEAVLKLGWDRVNWPNHFTAVHLAARCGHVGAVELLAASRGDLSAMDDWKLTPLDYAAQGSHQAAVTTLQRLLEQEGKTPVLRAGSKQNVAPGSTGGLTAAPQSTGSMVSVPPLNIPGKSGEDAGGGGKAMRRSQSTDQSTKVDRSATSRGSSAGATVNRFSMDNAADPLSQKRQQGSLTVPEGLRPELQMACEAVLRRGWSRLKWPHDFTALHLAAKFGRLDAVSFLLEASAAPALSVRDHKSRLPLDYARSSGNMEVVELLEASMRSTSIVSTSPRVDRIGSKIFGTPTSTFSTDGDSEKSKSKWAAAQAAVAHMVEDKLKLSSGHGFRAGIRAALGGRRREADLEDMGLEMLRAEVAKLRKQRDALDEERQRWLASGAVAAFNGAACGAGAAKQARGAGVLGGPLDEQGIIKFLKHLDTVGREKVFEKLQDNALTGGLDLSESDAWRALAQLDLVLRCSERSSGAKPEPAPVDDAPMTAQPSMKRLNSTTRSVVDAATLAESAEAGSEAAAAAAEAAVAAQRAAEMAGCPVTSVQEAVAAATAAATAGTSGKATPPAKGGGKTGPPPPGAKGSPPAQDDSEVPKDEAANATNGGKGSPPAGKKGPPAPGGKGKATPPAPGAKGPPAPGAKGPPAPGAKGPPAPGAKGPPAAGGKGPPAPGGKGPPTAPGGKGPAAGKDGGKKGKKGGAAAGGRLETKPVRTPRVQMKPLWWTKYVFGAQIQKGQTIWDHVDDEGDALPIDVLEERFCKNAVAVAKPKKEVKEEKKEEIKFLRIITDPNVVVGKEASLKQLPDPRLCARALEELDDEALSIDALKIMRENATPSHDQMKQLVEERTKNPNVPLALPEQYMWVIGHLPAYQQRMDCWMFIRTYDERQGSYRDALEEFDKITECFRDSETLPKLLGLLLATGNYLNGGTQRGQADGFDFETILKLESVKDATNKDLRHFVFDYFVHHLVRESEVLLQDLACVFSNINRRIVKDSDGIEKLNKSARYAYEDFDSCVVALKAELDERFETMQMIMQYFDDPADEFRMRMPGEFAKAKESIDGLVLLKDSVKDKYAKLLAWFKIAGMKSSDFCLIWDQLFVPADLVLNKPDKLKKEMMIPCFCRNKPFSIDDFMVLWEFREPDEDMKKKKRERRTQASERRRRGPGHRASVLAVPPEGLGLAGEADGAEPAASPRSPRPAATPKAAAASGGRGKGSSKGKGKAGGKASAPGKGDVEAAALTAAASAAGSGRAAADAAVPDGSSSSSRQRRSTGGTGGRGPPASSASATGGGAVALAATGAPPSSSGGAAARLSAAGYPPSSGPVAEAAASGAQEGTPGTSSSPAAVGEPASDAAPTSAPATAGKALPPPPADKGKGKGKAPPPKGKGKAAPPPPVGKGGEESTPA